jgi:hypothetical protein
VIDFVLLHIPYVVHNSRGPRRSQRIRKSVISDDYKVYVSEEYASQEYISDEFQMEGDLTSF